MTFRSRRKHQTTPPSTLRLKARKGLIALAGLSLLLGACSSPSMAQQPSSESRLKSAFKSPVKWLRNRSARKRWEKMKADTIGRSRLNDVAAEPNQKPLEPEFTPSGPNFVIPAQVAAGNSAIPLPKPQPREPGDVFLEAAFQDDAEGKPEVTIDDPSKMKRITNILPYADYKPGTTVQAKVDPNLLAPEEVELGTSELPPRQMPATLFQWQASNQHHLPLYFEDPGLERYGHAWHPLFQPIHSVGRFGVQLAGLPYQMTIDPVWKKTYTLGWYRPGEVAPKQIETIPWHTGAAINQAAVVTGMAFALP